MLLLGTFAKSSFMTLRLYVGTTVLPLFLLALFSLSCKDLYSLTEQLRTSPYFVCPSQAWGRAWRELWHSLVVYLSAVGVNTDVVIKIDSVWVILANNKSIDFFKLSVTLFDWSTLSLGELEYNYKNDGWSCNMWISHFPSQTLLLFETSWIF